MGQRIRHRRFCLRGTDVDLIGNPASDPKVHCRDRWEVGFNVNFQGDLKGNLGTLFPENEKSALSAEVPIHPLENGPWLIGSRDHHVGNVIPIR
ncbi:hypothetical protein D3C80_1097890 [compost metagenome]